MDAFPRTDGSDIFFVAPWHSAINTAAFSVLIRTGVYAADFAFDERTLVPSGQVDVYVLKRSRGLACRCTVQAPSWPTWGPAYPRQR